jgi:hypothetical protein
LNCLIDRDDGRPAHSFDWPPSLIVFQACINVYQHHAICLASGFQPCQPQGRTRLARLAPFSPTDTLE